MRLRATVWLTVLLPCVALAAPSDYYLGIAAVDSGRAAEGVEILKHYHYRDRHPDDPHVGLELARRCFIVGDNRRARKTSNAVKNTDPPREVATKPVVGIDDALGGYCPTDLKHESRQTQGQKEIS